MASLTVEVEMHASKSIGYLRRAVNALGRHAKKHGTTKEIERAVGHIQRAVQTVQASEVARS